MCYVCSREGSRRVWDKFPEVLSHVGALKSLKFSQTLVFTRNLEFTLSNVDLTDSILIKYSQMKVISINYLYVGSITTIA